MAGSMPDLVAALLAAWNAHDMERAARFYATDFVGLDVGQAGRQQGPSAHCAVMAAYIRAFPDLRITGETVCQDQRIALIWTLEGTHRGQLMRIPPTGRAVRVRGVSVLTIRDDQVCRSETIWDTAGLLRALGLLPEL